jgi:integrase
VSDQQAERAGWAYLSFQRWMGKDVSVTTITKETLTKYQTFRLASCARQTVEKEINFIRAMLKAEGVLFDKPLMPHGKSTPGRPFSEAELKAFFDACAEYPRADPGCYTHFWLLLLSTGARPAELVPSTRKSKHIPLLKKEIDLKSGTVMIRGAKLKAGERQKISRIPVDVGLLEMCLERAPEAGPHVFSPMHIAQLFDNILDRAQEIQKSNGVEESEWLQKVDVLGEKLTAHSFRHTFGTLLAESGASAFVIQNILRHADPRMTSRYLERARPQVDVIDITAYMPHRAPEQVEPLPVAAGK